ncbi:hypothetical protein HAX54_044505 [Datura stramonium]|uniref:Uncharacterized protein n=1 Tax=Datura stramonium TaxID=4076 RepID=A0ABS8WGV2_DATST|nr:hypothetical protein [Datura stramonium]
MSLMMLSARVFKYSLCGEARIGDIAFRNSSILGELFDATKLSEDHVAETRGPRRDEACGQRRVEAGGTRRAEIWIFLGPLLLVFHIFGQKEENIFQLFQLRF